MNSIKRHREAAGMLQEEVAGRLGVHQTAVSQWEVGNTLPRAATLKKLAELYGCTVDELLKGGEEE